MISPQRNILADALAFQENSEELVYNFRNNADNFLSLKMAYNAIKDMCNIDIIGDSAMIKKMLTMPYSNKELSVIIHNIDDTLLLEDFFCSETTNLDFIKKFVKLQYDEKYSEVFTWLAFQNFLIQFISESHNELDIFQINQYKEMDHEYRMLLVKYLYLNYLNKNGHLNSLSWKECIDLSQDFCFWENQDSLAKFIETMHFTQQFSHMPFSSRRLFKEILSKDFDDLSMGNKFLTQPEKKFLMNFDPLPLPWKDEQTGKNEPKILCSEKDTNENETFESLQNLSINNTSGAITFDAKDDFPCPPIKFESSHTIKLSQKLGSPKYFDPTTPMHMPGSVSDQLFWDLPRDYVWNFEDITMLIKSDLPIFGCGKYPAISLRLKDAKDSGINVLTGLDYWLDNLMCNVPELVMCYHLDGLIQRYEMLKTSEIPLLDFVDDSSRSLNNTSKFANDGKESVNGTKASSNTTKFDPELIKNLARNLLSFIRNKCTRQGHTYWLYKEPDDDIVKLYDLTSLLTTFNQNTLALKRAARQNVLEQQVAHYQTITNPYALPVAILLFKVAENIRKQLQEDGNTLERQSHHKCKNNIPLTLAPSPETCKMLLQQCRNIVKSSLPTIFGKDWIGQHITADTAGRIAQYQTQFAQKFSDTINNFSDQDDSTMLQYRYLLSMSCSILIDTYLPEQLDSFKLAACIELIMPTNTINKFNETSLQNYYNINQNMRMHQLMTSINYQDLTKPHTNKHQTLSKKLGKKSNKQHTKTEKISPLLTMYDLLEVMKCVEDMITLITPNLLSETISLDKHLLNTSFELLDKSLFIHGTLIQFCLKHLLFHEAEQIFNKVIGLIEPFVAISTHCSSLKNEIFSLPIDPINVIFNSFEALADYYILSITHNLKTNENKGKPNIKDNVELNKEMGCKTACHKTNIEIKILHKILAKTGLIKKFSSDFQRYYCKVFNVTNEMFKNSSPVENMSQYIDFYRHNHKKLDANMEIDDRLKILTHCQTLYHKAWKIAEEELDRNALCIRLLRKYANACNEITLVYKTKYIPCYLKLNEMYHQNQKDKTIPDGTQSEFDKFGELTVYCENLYEKITQAYEDVEDSLNAGLTFLNLAELIFLQCRAQFFQICIEKSTSNLRQMYLKIRFSKSISCYEKSLNCFESLVKSDKSSTDVSKDEIKRHNEFVQIAESKLHMRRLDFCNLILQIPKDKQIDNFTSMDKIKEIQAFHKIAFSYLQTPTAHKNPHITKNIYPFAERLLGMIYMKYAKQELQNTNSNDYDSPTSHKKDPMLKILPHYKDIAKGINQIAILLATRHFDKAKDLYLDSTIFPEPQNFLYAFMNETIRLSLISDLLNLSVSSYRGKHIKYVQYYKSSIVYSFLPLLQETVIALKRLDLTSPINITAGYIEETLNVKDCIESVRDLLRTETKALELDQILNVPATLEEINVVFKLIKIISIFIDVIQQNYLHTINKSIP